MRATALIALAVFGCSGKSETGDDTEPDPKGWTIDIDMSSTNRFVDPATSASWPVSGVATASEGLAGVDVADAPAMPDGDGAFAAMVSPMSGLTRFGVLATDAAGHQRKGDRTLLAARFLPDGAHNRAAASLVLDDAILASMGSGLAGEAGDVDVAGEIMARPTLSSDDQCTTWPVEASQGEVAVSLEQDRGTLWLHIQVPNLYVYFEGECQGLFSTIPIGGEMGGTIDVWTKLSPAAADADCLTAFAHTTPQVEVNDWGFGVWGLGGPLQNWIIDAFSGGKSEQARDQIGGEVGARADTMLADKLQHISVFDRTSELTLLDEQVGMHLCLAGIDVAASEGNGGTTLVARIAAAATSDGIKVAPGAPQIDGATPVTKPNELLLDANLVGQLLFASWKAGGLTRAAPDADIDILTVLVPELYDNFHTTIAQVAIDAELPPLVTATPAGPGDLKVEIGDLMIDLSLEGKRVFRFGAVLTLLLELDAVDGKLVPTVIDSSAVVSLLDERYDGPDDAIEIAIAAKIGGVAADLIGPNAAIALPDLPGLGAPKTVAVDPGGRFLRVGLE